MRAFTVHQGVAAPIMQDNIDTDQLIPSREMKRVSKSGLGAGLFAGWRYRYDGSQKIGPAEDFVLNQPAYRDASILLSGRNFGCGSSREHAVWALTDFGIRAIIAEGFGAIFRMNCGRNGLLAIDLPADQITALQRFCEADPQAHRLTIDLTNNRVDAGDQHSFAFSIDEADRHMLLNGLDFIDFSLQFRDDINRFAEAYRQQHSWAVLPPPSNVG
ncbi:MAG: 3-isopropylmalate dehydratase small subunit [Pseudomonadota bacterium]